MALILLIVINAFVNINFTALLQSECEWVSSFLKAHQHKKAI